MAMMISKEELEEQNRFVNGTATGLCSEKADNLS